MPGFPEATAAGRPRIVYVADTMAATQMLEGLAARFDVTLLVPESLADRPTNHWPPPPGVTIELVVLPGGRIRFVSRAARWLARHGSVYTAAVALDPLVGALGATLGHRRGGPPVVLQVGRPTLEYIRCQAEGRSGPMVWLRWLVARLLIAFNERRAAGIGTVSEYVGEQSRRHNPNVRAIAWQGVDPERFAPVCSKAEARERLGLPADQPIVMWRSRFAPEKDPDTFLFAVARLRAQGREVCALYMGGETEEMEERAAALGVEVLVRNASSADEIPLWYVAADINVQTSKAEGLGLSVMESLACLTPVVVCDTGGLPETVDGGRCGTIVPRFDVAATADAIARYLDDADHARAHAEAGRRFVAAQHSRSACFDAWSALIRSAVERPTRVLFVDHETRLSGGERDLVDLVRGLAPSALDLHAALPGEGALGDALRAHGVTVHVVEMGEDLRQVSRWDLARRPWVALSHLGAAVAASVRFARLARSLRPDIVHSNSLKAHLLAVPAARVIRAPHVWHVRDILETGQVRRAFVALAGLFASSVVCLSRSAARQFDGSRVAKRTHVVYNGVRPALVDDADVARWRARLGTPLVGIVGQIARWKGQDVFVDAAAKVADSRPEVRFAIVGECLFPENEAAYELVVRKRVEELGLTDRLVWTGSVEPIEPVMAALDVLVHASRLPEPFGRVMVEALAQGTPVVTTSLGAGPEIVTEAVGRVVPPEDPASLASAIVELLDTSGPVQSDAARARAAEFDISNTAAGVLDVYATLLA